MSFFFLFSLFSLSSFDGSAWTVATRRAIAISGLVAIIRGRISHRRCIPHGKLRHPARTARQQASTRVRNFSNTATDCERRYANAWTHTLPRARISGERCELAASACATLTIENVFDLLLVADNPAPRHLVIAPFRFEVTNRYSC